MKGIAKRVGRWAVLGAAVVFFAAAAVSCGGSDDDGGGDDTAIAGLGSNLDEIKEMARTEGQVNLVQWAGYADKSWADKFTQDTGCKVNTKDGASSDDMVQLMSTGEYDGVSASGDATLRLIARGDVAPVNTDLTPNYADVYDGLKDQEYNTVDGKTYGVPHGRGPNLLVFRSDVLPENTNSWDVVFDKSSQYKGKITWPDNPISIADAAVYLKATQPDLGIENPYALDQEQFDAAVNLLKEQNANIGEYWADAAKQVQSLSSKDSVVGNTWPYQMNLLEADKQPVKGIKPKEGTTGWSDTWMISSKAKNPNCMYLWMDYIISPEANAKVAEFFGEAPSNSKACDLTTDPDHCTKFHAEDESWWEDVYYWDTPTKDCRDDRGEVCKDYAEWQAAWTDIKG